MKTTEHEIISEVRMLTAEESWADFDGFARKHLGISGEEFLARLDAGEYDDVIDDPADHSAIVYLGALSRGVR